MNNRKIARLWSAYLNGILTNPEMPKPIHPTTIENWKSAYFSGAWTVTQLILEQLNAPGTMIKRFADVIGVCHAIESEIWEAANESVRYTKAMAEAEAAAKAGEETPRP